MTEQPPEWGQSRRGVRVEEKKAQELEFTGGGGAVEKQWEEILAEAAVGSAVWGAEGSNGTGRVTEGAKNRGRGDGMWG